MEEFKSDSSCFRQFLERFCQDHNGTVGQGEFLPHRLINYYLLEPEYDAECADWTLQYLTANKCPSLLASQVARAVAKEAQTWDKTPFLERVVEPSQEVLKDEDKDSSDTDILDDTDILEDDDEAQEEKLPQLEVARLAPSVFTHVHEICDTWRSQPPDFPSPKTSANISVWAIRNARRKMEDKHVVLPYLNHLYDLHEKPEQGFYAVFDGHGGVDAAVYASAQLHHHMVKHPAFDTDPLTSMKDAFIKTDENFVKKAEREGLKSGTTGVCALVRENKLHVAWLGDSQVLLVRNGEPVELMEPHKPEREDEKKRIEELGGCVVWFGVWRVNGSLSVSRAIGDADYKPYISGIPDLASFDLDGTEDYLVLGCDGLWDTVTPNEIVTDVYDYLQENANDRAGLAQKLTMIARERGSSDNISVIVVFFRQDIGTPKPRPDTPEKIEEPEGRGSANKEGSDPQGGDNNNEKKDSPENSDKSDSSPDGPSGDTSPKSKESQTSPKSKESETSTSSKETPDQMDVSSGSLTPKVMRRETRSDVVLTHQNLYLSDVQSETSSTDIKLLQSTAAKCINNRRAKRSKSGRRRSMKDVRRGSKEKMLGGLAHRTNNNTPTKGNNGKNGHEARQKPRLKDSPRGITRTGDNLFQMLTGCKPGAMRGATTREPGKWTVAVEIESGSAMFNE